MLFLFPFDSLGTIERGVEKNVMLDGLDESNVALRISEMIKSQ
jgi:hypothetical protein